MRDARGNKLVVRGGVLVVRDAAKLRRISKVRAYRDEQRAAEDPDDYLLSLPPPPADRAYIARDDNEQVKLFVKARGGEVGEDDGEGDEEEIQGVDLPKGGFYAQSSYDGRLHLYRGSASDEGAPLPTLNDLPARLTEQNKRNADFWRDQMAGAPNAAAPNAKAIAAALAAVMVADGVRDTPQAQQRANAAMNSRMRAHYAGRAQDPPRSKGFATPSQINRANRAKYTGRQ